MHEPARRAVLEEGHGAGAGEDRRRVERALRDRALPDVVLERRAEPVAEWAFDEAHLAPAFAAERSGRRDGCAAREARRREDNVERGAAGAVEETGGVGEPGQSVGVHAAAYRANRLGASAMRRHIGAAMSAPTLFDRALTARRLDRALKAGPADFLLARCVEELADRLALVKRDFGAALDFGTPGPQAAAVLAAPEILRIAPTEASLGVGRFVGLVGDPERPPVGEARFDLAVSLLALHQIDDLPGALIQIRRALKPDGLLLAALPGGDTLTELRQSLLAAESDLTGGASPRVMPFADSRALGGLLQRAGYALPVVDSDRFTVRYSDMFALMRDLRAFGATNALVARPRTFARRDLFLRAARHYAENFADADGRIRATFEILWLSGWSPHPSQPTPLKPGSAKMRLEDALKQVKG